MVWQLKISPSALKTLDWIKKREPALFPRVAGVLDELRMNPFQGKALKGEFVGRYSYRVGSYRVIYKMFKGELLIYVIDIGHRRDIYR